MRMQKTIILKNYFLTLVMLIMMNAISAQDLVSHDFNDGTLGPFEVCTTGRPNYSRVIDNRLETFWSEDAYNGTRTYRGAEACGDQFYTYKEGWYGMNLELGSDYPKNKKAGVAQVFGFTPGFWSWEAQLQIDNGDLTIVHRPNGGTGQNTEEVVYADFPYQVKVPIVIHFILSKQNKGMFEIWVDGKLEYQKTNINFGFGDFDNNDVKIGDADADRGEESAGSLTVFKMGQYNFESNDYDNNETRTVYYDDVSWYKGSNGYDIVNPIDSDDNNNGGTTGEDFTPDPNKTYYIDSAHHNVRLAATGESEDAYTTNVTTTGADVEWKFVDKGNGYWHIQRAAGGTKPRLRTDNSANADMQPTGWSGTYTFYDITKGDIANSYFLTLPNAPVAYNRLQINRSLDVKMVASANHNGTWESFKITEATVSDIFLEAEDYDSMSGIKTEDTRDTDGGENVGFINNNDWLRFNNINLSGITNIDARVATRTGGGTLEVRTGSTSGTLIGTIDVNNTGGFQNWETTSSNINTTNGVQDVYLVFKGGSGYLYNVNWVEFNRGAQSNKETTTTKLKENLLELYPNPVKDSFRINISNIQSVKVFNVSGELIKSFEETKDEYLINDLVTGFYLVKITDKDGQSSIKKLIKD